MKRKRETTKLSDVLAELAASPRFRRGRRLTEALEAVRQLLPPEATDGLQADRLDGGVLELTVPTSAQVQEIALRAPRVLARMKEQHISIREIKVRLRP